jgi:hypothetical protein
MNRANRPRLSRISGSSYASRLMSRAGDGSTLTLDFTTGVLDPRLSFSRLSNATFINSSGIVTSVGNNTPRFDHDPTTLALRGLLIEGQTANAVTYSDCRTTGWSGLNATGTNDSATAPDNTTTATLWTGGSGGGNRAYSQTFSVTSGNTYTASVYVKKPTSNAARYAKIYIRNSVEGVIGWPSNGVLDLDTGVISGTGYTVTPYSNGWYRIVSVGTITSTTNARVFIAITDSSGTETPTPTVTTALLWWGAQVESGSGASSYIPTGASTATRDPDNCVMTGTDFSSWFNASEGTLLLHAERAITSGSGRGIAINDNTNGEAIEIGSTSAGRFVVREGGIDVAAVTAGTVTANTLYKVAGAFASNDAQIAFNGTLGTQDTGVTLPTVDRLMIGKDAASPTPVYFNGRIRLFKFYPTRLPDATLQSLTT